MKNSKNTIDCNRISESIRRLNPGLFPNYVSANDSNISIPNPCSNGTKSVHQGKIKTKPVISVKKRIDKCNKTEKRFYDEFLVNDISIAEIIVQPTRMFELEGGGTYTPDFVTVTPNGIDVWEIKGHYYGPGWEQGIERFKRVATEKSRCCIKFHIATWNPKERKWYIEDWKQ